MKTIFLSLLLAAASFAAQFTISAVDSPVAGNPVIGVPFTVSGDGCSPGGYNTPRAVEWASGATCKVLFPAPTPHVASYYRFLSWEDGSKTAPRSFLANAAGGSIVAVAVPMYRVTVVINPPEGGRPVCEQKPGDECYVQAVPNVKSAISAIANPGWECEGEKRLIVGKPTDYVLNCRVQ